MGIYRKCGKKSTNSGSEIATCSTIENYKDFFLNIILVVNKLISETFYMLKYKKNFLAVIGAVSFSVMSSSVYAKYPTKPIQVVVPYI